MVVMALKQNVSESLKAAGRVARTVHQLIVTALITLPILVTQTDLAAEDVAGWSAVLVALGGVVAKVYNVIFPGEEPLDEF